MRCATIVARLCASHPHVEAVVLCGGNAQLRAALERSDLGCVVEGYIPAERVRYHLRRATLVLGKPGPGAVSEACASGTPVVTERRYAMPQERSVLEWLQTTGVGVVVDDLERLPDDLLERANACAAAIAERRAAHGEPPVAKVAGFLQTLIT